MTWHKKGVLTAIANVDNNPNLFRVHLDKDPATLAATETTIIYEGCSPVTTMVPYEDGVLSVFANASCQPGVYRVIADTEVRKDKLGAGRHLYSGPMPVTALTVVKEGILIAFAHASKEPGKYSLRLVPRGQEPLDTQGIELYKGCSPVTALVPHRGGVLAVFARAECNANLYRVHWSKDLRRLADRASMVWESACSQITAVTPYKNGVLAAFATASCQPNLHRVEWIPDARQKFEGVARYNGSSPVPIIASDQKRVLTAFVLLEKAPPPAFTSVSASGHQRFELGWSNWLPCSKIENVATSIPGVSLPTLYTGEQRVYAYAAVDGVNLPQTADLKGCIEQGLGACAVSSIVAGPETCAPAFRAHVEACVVLKVVTAAINSLKLTVEPRCMW
jgi:hypothetical protein